MRSQLLRRLLWLAGACLLVAAAACSSSDDGGGEGINVVATTTQIGDFARNVGGDRIDLTVLLSPNQDAHDFELEPSQIRAVAEADLILRNGLGLDDFLDGALESSSAAVATLSASIETREGDEEGEEHEEHEDEGVDAHVWFSVANARRMVENLRDALIAEDAGNAEYYRESTTAYLQELDALDADIRTEVEAIPEQCRKLVTNHDVLGYYAEAYGFEVAGSVIPSTSSEAQASAADVADIVRAIREAGVPAIFAEASINPDLIQQVGREAGVLVVDDLHGDSLGPPGSDGATYIEMMRSNTQKIAGALKACSP
jgi:ABC-type Zn uptake system ZnuABC Zn-binding protein ZnuA